MGLGSSKLTPNEKAVCNSAVAHHRSVKKELSKLPNTETFDPRNELPLETNSNFGEENRNNNFRNPAKRTVMTRRYGRIPPRTMGGKRKTQRNRRRS
jgi:hypothetical protein